MVSVKNDENVMHITRNNHIRKSPTNRVATDIDIVDEIDKKTPDWSDFRT